MASRETRYPRGSRLLLEDWKSAFYHTLRDQPYPLLVFDRNVVPAASLWTGARLWVRAFRAAGLGPGDRVVLAVPPSPEFLYVMIAALSERLCLAPIVVHDEDLTRPDFLADVQRIVTEEADARLAVVRGNGTKSAEYIWATDAGGLPPACNEPAGESFELPQLRSSTQPAQPDLRLLLRTSGSTAQPRLVALTDANLFAVLMSHQKVLRDSAGDDGIPRVLSVLPWAHAFGLMIDLLPALLSRAEIVRDPQAGRSTRSILSRAQEHDITHLSGVPLIFRRLFADADGRALVRRLRGGVIGGAPVTSSLARELRSTRLRAGYGQTEAGPGLTLGEPGEWPVAGYLGRAAGCELRVNDQQELEFRGANVCAGIWNGARGLQPLRTTPDGFAPTGDLVGTLHDTESSSPAFVFQGRRDDSFKLENGRFVRAGMFEARLIECFPDAMDEVIVYSPDGASILVGYVRGNADGAEPSIDAVRRAAGLRVDRVQALDPRNIVRTRKGEIDRRRTLERLTN